MKKLLAVLVALGFLLGGGAALSVAAGSGDYMNVPPVNVPVSR
jgi:glutamate-1-semialdehyde aminotransferase